MSRNTFRTVVAVTSLAAITACANASAERAAKLAADSARAEGASTAEVTRRTERARTAAAAPVRRTRTRTLPAGTMIQLVSVTDVTSQKDEAGKPFTARTTSATLNAAGDTVIPAGAELIGTVTALYSASSPSGTGRLDVGFSTIRFGGQDFPIDTRVVSLATREVSRGITASDAAKVGVGAAVGAVAGQIIGRNTTGAVVGGAAGGAAGVVYANRSKDHDIVISPGSSVEVALTSPFSRVM